MMVMMMMMEKWMALALLHSPDSPPGCGVARRYFSLKTSTIQDAFFFSCVDMEATLLSLEV